MPSDYHRIRHNFPKLSGHGYAVFMHTLETAVGFGSSDKAKFKFHCIEFYGKHGWRAFHDAFPEVSRASLFRWRSSFLESGKHLNALVPKSTQPHITRQMRVPSEVLGFLKAMRKKYPHLSKYKLKPFLDEFCKKHGLPLYSVSWIGKILNRYQLFFGIRKRVSKRRKQSRSGYTIKRTPKPKNVKLGYLQLDGVVVYWAGEKVRFFTALEVKIRTAWVKLVPSFSSLQAKTFLQEILETTNYQIHTIHTDNGSEFHALFDQVVIQLELTHLWSPPKTPKVHAHIERFNGVIQQEFIDYHIDTAVVDRQAFQAKLDEWLCWYNTKRPHHSLNLMTPHQYLLHSQKGDQSLKCP